MTPAARVQAAIEVLDAVQAGAPAEQALTRWARASRFAGSKDRRAVRDHVFDVLRRKRSLACLGGGDSGRALMLGLLRAEGADVDAVFTGARHQPACLSEDERTAGHPPATRAEAWNLPDWLVPLFEDALGETAAAQCHALASRAPVFVRVNLLKTHRDAAIAALAEDGIEAAPHPQVATALRLGEGAARLRNARAFADGLVEPQDASSQSVVADLPECDGPILDLCAGGGGKTLALAARYGRDIDAWDANPARMVDLPARAARAGATIRCLPDRPSGPYALVLCDAPCSGSGAWRRDPGGKWLFTQEKLDDLTRLQADILSSATGLVAPGGTLAYATCSVLRPENEAQADAFLSAHPGWVQTASHRHAIDETGDGFFSAHLKRD
ncbi:RsmB/NOP family class I SAM-dependent RNA methyltransferase [Pseudaestuariivita atlantica]|uniref:SAM-dependent methyltransferase n=1 Tax=Pseudaestuariivita atlantica TaxID=1317121 RepID=A0A0L1JKY2_9RHOB|nr:RsmB/NOP family class I SAM-dependent RNA methyltransferase [Pseudaestuariivita atlantica]KNG92414.1 SAM-dependent methyltransferase [Pseudaestuariivita atlantica]